jgi:hypothetical protein
MKLPRANQTGLAKAATILAAMLLVSVPLCGVNAILFGRFGVIAGGPPPPGHPIWPTPVLMITGLLEIAGMIAGTVGLLVIAIIAIIRSIQTRLSQRKD